MAFDINNLTEAEANHVLEAGRGRDAVIAALKTLGYATAASHGLPGAYMNLGTLWECGAGGLQDHEEAAVCFARDAEIGVVEAQNRLALLYLPGRGIERNLAMAYFWFMIAAAGGHEDAAKQRDMATAFMTPAELGKAQRAAREWSAPPPTH